MTIASRRGAALINDIRKHERKLKGTKLGDDFLIIALAICKQMALTGTTSGPSENYGSAWSFLGASSSSATFSSEEITRAKDGARADGRAWQPWRNPSCRTRCLRPADHPRAGRSMEPWRRDER